MRMATHVRKRWNVHDLSGLPEDGNKYEIIRGELFVTPAPRPSHETILARLTRILDPYVAANDLGYVYRARAVLAISDDTEVEPDLMVRQPPLDETANWSDVPMPILIAEVSSDSTRRRDRVHKRTLYSELQIPEYWIVDPEDRSIRVVRLDQPDAALAGTLLWHPSGVTEPLAFSIASLFR